jgi:hypothetical protein
VLFFRRLVSYILDCILTGRFRAQKTALSYAMTTPDVLAVAAADVTSIGGGNSSANLANGGAGGAGGRASHKMGVASAVPVVAADPAVPPVQSVWMGMCFCSDQWRTARLHKAVEFWKSAI